MNQGNTGSPSIGFPSFSAVYRVWAQQRPLYQKKGINKKYAAICIAIIEKTDVQGLG